MEGSATTVREVQSDDTILVERFRKGDKRAFDEIYHRHAKVLATIAYRMLGDDLDLDDIVQDTFLAAARKMDSLKEPDRLRSWLITIAVRRVKHTIAQRSRKRMMMREVKHEPRLTYQQQGTAELKALQHALNDLSPKLRLPWMLHRVEGETLAETAKMCELSLATVKRRVREADTLIQRRLDSDT